MNLPPVLRQRYFDSNGSPLVGGKLYTYEAGTSTPLATYTTQAGSTANANPIVLDANGEATMWLDPLYSYKFVLKDADGNTQWTTDNVVGGAPNVLVNVNDYGAIGDGLTNDIEAFIAAAASLTDDSALYIPPGEYVFDFSSYTVGTPVYPVTGIINLTGKTNIRIYSDGARLKITNLNTQTKGGWSIINLSECSDVVIDGIKFDVRGVTGLTTAAAEPNYPFASAIVAGGTTWRNLTIQNCEFTSYNPLGAAPNPSGSNYNYKQMPVYVYGDTTTDSVRGFRFINNVMRDVNTYKVFLLGVGGVEITGNKFLDIAGLYPCVRNLIHASRGHIIEGNFFEGLDPADDDAPNNVSSVDLPSMVQIANATNKGGGGAVVSNNIFALTGSGGVNVNDATGVSISNNTFYDRVSMASILTTNNNVVSCIHLLDEASGSGSYPATDVSITGNTVLGTVTRKIVTIVHGLNGSITGNAFKSAAGYGIQASRARNFIISGNDVAGVSSHDSNQVGVSLTSGSGLAAGEYIKFHDNIIHSFTGGTGTGIGTISFDNTKCFIYGNSISGVGTNKTAGVQDQLSADFLRFSNDATRVSSTGTDLDWYEEGTFTPTIIGTGTAGAGTYTTQIGRFTRIGNRVFYSVALVWTAHTGTSNMFITGLPYTVKNTSGHSEPCSISYGDLVITAGKQLAGSATPNTINIQLAQCDPGGGAVALVPIDTASSIYVSGHYEV